MFQVIITNEKDKRSPWVSEPFETEKEAQEWLAKHITKEGKLQERIVSIKEEYNPEDVLEVIQEEVDGKLQDVAVRLKAQAEVLTKDLSKDIEYLTEKATTSRKKEYPSLEESVFAILHNLKTGRPDELDKLFSKIEEVDLKYPLPKESIRIVR